MKKQPSIIIDKTSPGIDFNKWLANNDCTITIGNATPDMPHSCNQPYFARLDGRFKDNVEMLEGVTLGPWRAFGDTKQEAIDNLKSRMSDRWFYLTNSGFFVRLFSDTHHGDGRFPRFA